jgi:rubrerythrin
MVDMGSIAAALGGLKTAGEIAKALLQLKSDAERQAKVIELQSVILAAQSSAIAAQSDQFAMLEEVRALEKEIARVKAWEAQKRRYKLHAPWGGAAVYALKKSMSDGEPAHWICTHCYEDGRRSILQFGYRKEGGPAYLCPSCEAAVHYPFLDVPQDNLPYAPE